MRYAVSRMFFELFYGVLLNSITMSLPWRDRTLFPLRTTIREAAIDGNLEFLKSVDNTMEFLLELESAEHWDDGNPSLFHIAVTYNHVEMFRYLCDLAYIRRGPQGLSTYLSQINCRLCSPFGIAVNQNLTEIVEIALSYEELDFCRDNYAGYHSIRNAHILDDLDETTDPYLATILHERHDTEEMRPQFHERWTQEKSNYWA